jgi:hypothetical protein
MGTYIMKFHIARQELIKGVQEEFNKTYPFLKIEFSRKRELPPESSTDRLLSSEGNSNDDNDVHLAAKKILWDDFGCSDTMQVSELEILLQYQFGLPVQILRKSGNLWMETRNSRHWTLRQQNNHGEDIASGFEGTAKA